MKKFKKVLLMILLVLWQLPQAILGGILFLVYRKGASVSRLDGKPIIIEVSKSFPGGISLWPFIILQYNRALSIAHESGHCRQSLYLGWLYLPVVGLCSGIHCLWHRYHKEKDYYLYWCEKWADKLGGVKRDKNGKRYV